MSVSRKEQDPVPNIFGEDFIHPGRKPFVPGDRFSPTV